VSKYKKPKQKTEGEKDNGDAIKNVGDATENAAPATKKEEPFVKTTLGDIKEEGATKRIVTVNVAKDDMLAAKKKIFNEYARGASIPGFRPGKAPIDIIERLYGENIRGVLGSAVIRCALETVEKESKLEIYNVSDITGLGVLPHKELKEKDVKDGKTGEQKDTELFDPSKDVTLSVQVEIVPEFKLPEYTGLKLDVPVETVTDEEVEKAIERIRADGARFEMVERPAGKGDYVKLSYTGTIDGKPVKEIAPAAHRYGTQASTWEEAGEENSVGIPEIIAGIIGLKKGDKATFTHEFPADFDVPELAGKKAEYAVEIFEVRSKILPEINAEFLERAGVKDADELRARVRESIQENKDRQTKNAKNAKVVELLLANADFEVPESAINDTAERLFHTHAFAQVQAGTDWKEIESSHDTFIKEHRAEAIAESRKELILEKIAKKEEITVTGEEVSYALARHAYALGEDPKKFLKDASQNRNRLREVAGALRLQKAIELVVEKAA
jgi:trigger factor